MTTITAESLAWQATASCHDSADLYFGPDGETSDARTVREEAAKAICAGCPVWRECLEWALIPAAQHGVAAGLSPEELRRYRVADRSRRRRTA